MTVLASVSIVHLSLKSLFVVTKHLVASSPVFESVIYSGYFNLMLPAAGSALIGVKVMV